MMSQELPKADSACRTNKAQFLGYSLTEVPAPNFTSI
jgi:hypothetical protein